MNQDSPIEAKNKQVVFLSGRVHPGESPSSWVMRGVIHYLTGPSEAARNLRYSLVKPYYYLVQRSCKPYVQSWKPYAQYCKPYVQSGEPQVQFSKPQVQSFKPQVVQSLYPNSDLINLVQSDKPQVHSNRPQAQSCKPQTQSCKPQVQS